MKYFNILLALSALFCCTGNSYADTPETAGFRPGFMDEEVGGELLNQSACSPEYPRASLRNEETGAVILELLIGQDGRVQQGKINKSSGFRNLDNATYQAIVKCIYRPYSKTGKPFVQKQLIQYVWRLE